MKPFQNMVVGYDGSPDALNAVTWALDAARAVQANVTIVHAIGLIEHMHEHLSRDTLPTALVALAQECDFDTAALQWLVEDGDACSVMLRMTDRRLTQRSWSWVRAAKESEKVSSWAAPVSNSSNIPRCRSSSSHRVSPSVEHVRTSMVGFLHCVTVERDVVGLGIVLVDTTGCRPPVIHSLNHSEATITERTMGSTLRPGACPNYLG